MVQARLTGKGQVTIPKAIRDYLHLDTGSKIDFAIYENGEVKVIPLKRRCRKFIWYSSSSKHEKLLL